ncbi:MAG: DUF3450 domain-containing protein [Prevotella sp.]|nr:DUF3450 domain-containing protein [Prevotella sp.]MDE6151665.1 DUF3450 domain-containing protein [Prevotella sp.]
MFSSSRVNQTIYILYKESVPRIEIGSITQVTQPVSKYPMGVPYGTMQEQVVDVYANVGGSQRQFQQLPADKESADFKTGNVFVTISRDAMNAEISNLKNESVSIINRVDEERQKIVKYDEILMQLNPEFAEKQRQEQEIANLKNQVAQLAQTNSNLENMMARLMEKLDGDGTKPVKNK